MMVLASAGVLIYLADLQGVWDRAGWHRGYMGMNVAIDLIILFDLVLKGFAFRGAYLKSAWFFIDFVSMLPILSLLPSVPDFLQGLLAIRILRVFRVLRTLRAVRLMRPLRIFRLFRGVPVENRESRIFERALYLSTVVYTLVFIGLMASIYQGVSTEEMVNAKKIEFYMVLGSLLGMLFVLIIVRFQIPDLSTQQIRTLLHVALPHQVAEHFIHNPESYDVTVRMPATIVFCDLKGFTRTVEGLGGDLDRLKMHLERAMDAVVDVHRQYDLIVDKFIGDAIMSFRGGNLSAGTAEEHAYQVVKAGLEGAKALRVLNDPYFNQIKVGGASTPDCLIGTFGTSKRLSYTVLGDGVNLAARLEPASGQCRTENLFCETTRHLTRNRPDLVWRRVGKLRVPGKSRPIEVHEVFDAADIPNRQWLDVFHQALEVFDRGLPGDAKALFEKASSARPNGDETSQFYVTLCQGLIDDGIPAGWEPVIHAKK